MRCFFVGGSISPGTMYKQRRGSSVKRPNQRSQSYCTTRMECSSLIDSDLGKYEATVESTKLPASVFNCWKTRRKDCGSSEAVLVHSYTLRTTSSTSKSLYDKKYASTNWNVGQGLVDRAPGIVRRCCLSQKSLPWEFVERADSSDRLVELLRYPSGVASRFWWWWGLRFSVWYVFRLCLMRTHQIQHRIGLSLAPNYMFIRECYMHGIIKRRL